MVKSFVLLLLLEFAGAYTGSGPTSIVQPEGPLSPERPQRRARYNGRYPKDFQAKYKELQGDESVQERVRAKGGTPAGTHIPIMVDECLFYMGLGGEMTPEGVFLEGPPQPTRRPIFAVIVPSHAII